MFEPNSQALVIVLAIIGVAVLVLLVRIGRRWLRALLAASLAAVSLVGGLVAVNDYYGYYQSWTQVADDFGSGTAPTAIAASHGTSHFGVGTIRTIRITGATSGLSRPAYVYLPPQYHERSFAHVRFPVVELFHGSPGSPRDWLQQLRIGDVMTTLMNRHLIGPTVVVMPTDNAGNTPEECLNSSYGADETYLTTDLRRVVEHRFRVSRVAQEWAAGGFSSGGYCAANLALRHRQLFGAAFALDGYFDPTDGPAARILGHNVPEMNANNPLRRAAHTQWGGRPVPAFWLAAGAGSSDQQQAEALLHALSGVEQVPLVLEPGGRHNYYAWAAALPAAMTWAWEQVAPPGLRHRFPIAGKARPVRIAPMLNRSKHGSRHESRHGSRHRSTHRLRHRSRRHRSRTIRSVRSVKPDGPATTARSTRSATSLGTAGPASVAITRRGHSGR